MILALETSTRRASLAVYDRESGRIVDGADFTTDRAHNAAIFAPLERLVAAHRDQLDGIVVGLGPGSYGGVRVGIAVANGLSVAMGLPLIGGNSLEAWETADDSYLVVGDARRGSCFVAVVRDRKLQGEPELVDDADLDRFLAPLRAEGLAVHTCDAKVVEGVAGAILSYPEAGHLAARYRDADLNGIAQTALEPVYLRAPYITVPKAK
jgi:tRNA threonylcarbamoyl adenosine modification protein YeaZ